ncbi:rhomboid family intramembrane serine protease [Wukongibacter baidiensis]|uniref:rhomboid family intramembrane serine protease n=1 Tax=Wukongibacter baidiensis TaxID=1723361 RepID=UPI003D8000BE
MTRNRKIYLTYIITAINVLLCIVMFLIDKSFSFNVETLLKFGAKYNPLIATGEYYRLLTSMFLHSDLTHLLFNMYALNIFGKNIERIYGKAKFIIIYIVAGLFGGLGSFIFSDSVSVGASGAIFGLLGAYFYLYLSHPDVFKGGYLKNLLTILGVNLLFGILVPNIDNWAHICGLIGGFIVSWSVGFRGEGIFSSKKVLAQLLTIILLFTSLFAGIQLNQNSWKYNLFQGEKYLDQSKLDEAEQEFITGISRKDDVELFYYNLGRISLIRGDLDKAKDYFERAVEINPEFIEAIGILNEINKIKQ